ncbi:universal stress protein [Planococcus lenghuensis]|uniref:UspA domain-containing protein n=1 Tax=Planococcus lenghuensis TaxID=2213202 RepID=A0A1Q2L2U9_9BACL|nr:universal stress protein [Planococcus lenghuensis]AQQ54788.1 hypothetical protein B0X71_17885 [Planococcus lenghuensis]
MSVQFKNILVGYDGSDWSKKALEAAVKLASEEPRSKINIVTAVPPVTLYYPAISSYETVSQESHAKAEEMLTEARELVGEPDLIGEVKMLEGNPPQQIIRYAENNETDLIIVGSRGLGNIKELFLGSTSHNVTQKAHCPVLIVK